MGMFCRPFGGRFTLRVSAQRCLLLAQSRHFETEFRCSLLGVKRTSAPYRQDVCSRPMSEVVLPDRSWCTNSADSSEQKIARLLKCFALHKFMSWRLQSAHILLLNR